VNSVVAGADSHVCAVIVSRIGDTLLMTPALRAMRAACARLTVLAHPQRLQVLRHLDFIDELAPISKYSAWWRALLAPARYDVALCWGREPALLRYCSRVARRCVAFDYPELRRVRGGEILRVPVPAESSLHAVHERALLAEAAGAALKHERLAYVVTPEERRRAREWIASRTPARAHRLIGLQTFSFPTKAHRDWPLERFVELSRRLCDLLPDAHLLALGDAAAKARVTAFAEALPGRVTVAAGELTLRDSAAVMQQLALYVGVDTGPTHIAGALGIPMVALYHPRYPGRNLRPLDHPRCKAIEGNIDSGMEGIPVEAVLAAAQAALADRALP
jgi:heptosyltransferase-3